MRAATALLVELTNRGIQLAANGGRLRYRPAEAVSPELRADLLRHKQDLLAMVQHLAVPPLPTGTWGRCASALVSSVRDDARRLDLRESFEERLSICQFDGHLSTDEAERIAFIQICRAVTAEIRTPSPTDISTTEMGCGPPTGDKPEARVQRGASP